MFIRCAPIPVPRHLCLTALQMLRAIWPSIEHLPNHLPENANITTAGIMCYFLYWLIQVSECLAVFPPPKTLIQFAKILVPLSARVSATYTLALCCKSRSRPSDMVGDAYLGVCQGASTPGDHRRPCEHSWASLVVGLALRVELGTGYLLNTCCQHT